MVKVIVVKIKLKLKYKERNKMNNPNDFQCDICGNTLTSESCFCENCKTWLCNGCAFEDKCEERQG